MKISTKLKKEKVKLDKKLFKLTDFYRTEAFDSLDESSQNLLIIQSTAMAVYSNTLKARIDLLSKEGK